MFDIKLFIFAEGWLGEELKKEPKSFPKNAATKTDFPSPDISGS